MQMATPEGGPQSRVFNGLDWLTAPNPRVDLKRLSRTLANPPTPPPGQEKPRKPCRATGAWNGSTDGLKPISIYIVGLVSAIAAVLA